MSDSTLRPYREFRPTQFDSKGLALNDQQHWLVAPVSQTRDSGPLAQSNFDACLEALGGESDTVEVHRFGHWGPGWFEIIVIDPADTEKVEIAEDIERALENYPVLDDVDFSEREHSEANEVWANCYNNIERINYIRENRRQFDFHNFEDLMRCAKGQYFCGYASELLC